MSPSCGTWPMPQQPLALARQLQPPLRYVSISRQQEASILTSKLSHPMAPNPTCSPSPTLIPPQVGLPNIPTNSSHAALTSSCLLSSLILMRENCVNFCGVTSLGNSATLNMPTRGGPAAAASYFAFCACAHSDVSNAFASSSVANAGTI
jgi:hypothetical protein